MVDVCLVSMPFARVESPSLALGILKAVLDRENISSKVLYPNLALADEIGLLQYKFFSEVNIEFFIGEWIFSDSAFPGFESDNKEYFKTALKFNQKLIDLLLKTRLRSHDFMNRLTEEIIDINPKIVSCSSTFHQNCSSLALLRKLKEAQPSIITIMGGANCEGIMGHTIQNQFGWIDFVCSGEGEEVFPELCKLLLEDGNDLQESQIPYGVFGKQNKNIDKHQRAYVSTLDKIPIPNFDDYFKALGKCRKISPYIEPGLFIETTRGCWWGQKSHCTFCGLNGQSLTYRSKSPERVINELSELSAKYKTNQFFIVDNILNLDFFKTVLPTLSKLSTPYSIFWEVKANLNFEQLKMLSGAGVNWIQPGIEGLHDKALILMRKGTTALTNIQLLKWGQELGINILWNYLVGIPKENPDWHDEVLTWLPLISHLQPPVGVRNVEFHRFSPYHSRAEEFDLDLQALKAYSYIYPLKTAELNNIAYYFQKSNDLSEDLRIINYAASNYKNLKQYVDRWKSIFYSKDRPRLFIDFDSSHYLSIKDSRPCAVQKNIAIDGLAYKIYKCCEQYSSLSRIKKCLDSTDKLVDEYSVKEISEILQYFESKKIILKIKNKYLSLATNQNPHMILNHINQPGGYINIHEYIENEKLKFWDLSNT